MNSKARRKQRHCKWLVLLSLLLVCGPASANSDALDTIQTKISQCLKRPGSRSAEWGIEVIDPAHEKVLISINPDKPFLPASVIKIITTAAALEKLGPDFRFRTGVYTNGTIKTDGVLDGDVILVGRGDPNLADSTGDLLEKPALVELRERLCALGIRKITGGVIGDDSYFDPTTHGKGWTARDLMSSYAAPISALSICNNIVRLYALPAKLGQLVRVSIDPRTAYFGIRNLGTTGSRDTRQTLYARVLPGTKRLVVSGVLPASRRYSCNIIIEKPADFAATLFREELNRHEITVDGNTRTIRYGDIAPADRRGWILLAEHQSPPLIRSLESINKDSENLHAEMLLRVLGAEFRGIGSDDAGLDVVREFLLESDIGDDKISLHDGSGLSRDNILTPRFQTALLLFLSTRPYFDLFLNTLAVSGTDGTLKHRLASESVKGVIYAKTGSLKGVATISGYMTTKSGRNLIFSIFANNAHSSIWQIRKTIDEICTLFVRLY